MALNVLDACSGLGGFSEAMVQAGDNVIRVDLDPKFRKIPFTVTVDILTYTPPFVPDIVVASPPCEAFSIARYPYEKKHGRHPQYELMVQIARHCVAYSLAYPNALVVVENPLGRLRHEIGMPQETLDQCMYGRSSRKRTDLWGNYTKWGSLARVCNHPPHVGHVPSFSKYPNNGFVGGWGRSKIGDESKAERGRIPIEPSRAVRNLYVAPTATFPIYTTEV